MGYELTNIWRSAMTERGDDPYAVQRGRLRAAYQEFWDNAVVLAGEIAKDLPNLTLHDERHFQSLWDRADQILGNAEPLNPLETFVFGSAILLHDAANCVAAYQGQLEEIEASPEWRDEVADSLRSMGVEVNDQTIEKAPAEIRRYALLSALRRLHGARAEELATLEFTNERTGKTHHLLPSDHLRTHLGRVIGLVAASHHWEIQDLPKKLQKTLGTIAGYPSEWTIRPIRIACLLRCADALQIDQSRTPDFLFALLRLRGLSEAHWRAQNKLAAPAQDPQDASALVFTSTGDFAESDADSWWIAYDAINVANRELQDAQSLLKDLRQAPFQISRIRDAESPERVSRHMTTAGWRPVSAEVRIQNVEQVVRMFGGEQLYGDDYTVPLRELIQNAADAIRFRRELAAEPRYSGEITVRLMPDTEIPGTFWLEVDDDGIGMSEAALTGPLIDFGASYFGSALAKVERPGLSAASIRRIGKYGIGFFSVFMMSDEIAVTSRPYEASLSDSRTLRFLKGLTLRPLLLERRPLDFSALVSTRVSLKLRADAMNRLLPNNLSHGGRIAENLQDLVGHLCPMLDIDLYVEQAGFERQLIHSRYWPEEDRLIWLRRALRAGGAEDEDFDEYLSLAAPLLAPVDKADYSCGLAAIPFRSDTAASATIGGLATRGFDHFLNDEEYYVGCLDHESTGPRRSGGNLRAAGKMGGWASLQAQEIAKLELTLSERHFAALAVARWGGDPIPIASISVDRELKALPDVIGLLCDGATLTVVIQDGGIGQVSSPGRWYYEESERNEIELISGVVEGEEDGHYFDGTGYYEVAENCNESSDEDLSSFLSCLKREAAEHGDLEIRQETDVLLGRYIGLGSAREGLHTGQEIRGPALLIRLVPRAAASGRRQPK